MTVVRVVIGVMEATATAIIVMNILTIRFVHVMINAKNVGIFSSKVFAMTASCSVNRISRIVS
jgi:hypothetical protein